MLLRPADRGAEVLQFTLEALKPLFLRGPAQLAVAALRELRVEACVSLDDIAGLRARRGAVRPRTRGSSPASSSARSRTAAGSSRRAIAACRGRRRDLLGGRRACSRRRRRRAIEEALLVLGEKVVAPGDRRAQRLMAGLGVSAASEAGRAAGRAARGSAPARAPSCAPLRARPRAGGRRGARRARRSRRIDCEPGALAEEATASDEASGGTGYSTSPRTRRSSRLVTSSVRFGHAASERRELGCGLDHLLQVVEEQQHLALADVLREPVLARPASERSSPSRATGLGARPARPRRRRPCTPTSSAPASSASRVLPEPPGPLRVTSRVPPRACDAPRASSRSRPTNEDAGRGRFVFEIVFSGGKLASPELKDHDRLRRCPSVDVRPRSSRDFPSTSARVDLESSDLAAVPTRRDPSRSLGRSVRRRCRVGCRSVGPRV